MSGLKWWTPERHGARRELLAQRARAKAAVRGYLDSEGFMEVECGAMQVSPGCETHLHAFGVERRWDDGERRQLYLHTSPEFACKKLLAAGEKRIFSLGFAYRNREEGPLHSPEFTLLEWYRTEVGYGAVQEDCWGLAGAAQGACGGEALRWRDRVCDARLEPERLSVADAFARYAKVDLDGMVDDLEVMRAVAAELGLSVSADDTWSDLFSRMLVRFIEPELGQGRLTMLDRYPTSEAALARRCADDPRYAERFEMYACGVELANGFGELTDPVEQRARFEAEMVEKQRIYGEAYPVDEDFLEALAIMPEASGCALGFDRLVMLAAGASKIDHVVWTPSPGRPDRGG